MRTTVQVAVVDDHTLFRKGLINLISSLDRGYEVVMEASNGQEFLDQLLKMQPPDIAIVDINMPKKDGFAVVASLRDEFPDTKVLVISMIEKEEAVVRMLKLGVKGYLSKDVEPVDLGRALDAIYHKGFYYTDFITGRLLHELQRSDEKTSDSKLTERERELLCLACTELTYRQIGDRLGISVKTVDIYRNALFKKLNVVSRVGLAIYAIRHGYVDLKTEQ
jgi:DNA-binding NarL/FixJ family response regulator